MKIVSRPTQRGDECESKWPPDHGTGEAGVFYWDRDSKKFKPGYPPQRFEKFGEAPYVIQDTIEEYYHPAACVTVDSRARLRDLDKVCGTITSGEKLAPDPTWHKQQEKARRKDLHECIHKAVAQIDAGTAPLNEEQKARCTAENERISNLMGFDAFNVAGRKNNAKGKRYRRR